MKKTLLLSAMAAVFLFGCKKDHTSPGTTAQKKYPVTFNMKDFTQTISSVSGKQQVNSLKVDSATANVAAYTTVLHLTIFNSGGSMIREFRQLAGVANYGIIVDSLANGTYTVVVDAGQNFLELPATYGNATLSLTNAKLFYDTRDNGGTPVSVRVWDGLWSDTFFDKFQLTVNNGAVSQNVTLHRIVGKLEVDFNDVIPTNAARVDMFLNKEDFEYGFATASPQLADTITTHFVIPDSVKGTSNYKFSQIVLNTTTPFSVSLTAYDNANHVIATHAVSNVTCTVNQRTILSGNFSNTVNNNNNGFSISVDPNWSTPSTVHY
ncbi:hypothetical protein [Mucilaginibacter ginsenosidivorans]|uniref:hypothetical protein n=1 Tax=Mucilaginibacter ginsenosidivorans TaxID=398053 RepID=UPI0016526362|nr:hypothetical protein [Mucilaginibacter ginsenosidivorans]